MRTPLLFALLGPLTVFVGCGVGSSQSGTIPRDGGPGVDSGPIQTSDAGGCGVDPGPECLDCNGNPVDPICQNGAYQCPTYGCPVTGCDGAPPYCGTDCNGNTVNATCPNGTWECVTYNCSVDAGYPCENEPPINCPGNPDAAGCSYWLPECVDNAWSCVEYVGDCFDASPDDASFDAPFDAPVPPPLSFQCGNVTCDPATTYCQVTTGSSSEDGGSNYFYCPPIPNSCAPGEAATCACVQADEGIGCGCIESGGDVTVTCVIQ